LTSDKKAEIKSFYCAYYTTTSHSQGQLSDVQCTVHCTSALLLC